jgi:hypothetical protein
MTSRDNEVEVSTIATIVSVRLSAAGNLRTFQKANHVGG